MPKYKSSGLQTKVKLSRAQKKKKPAPRVRKNPFTQTAQDQAAAKLGMLEKVGANFFKTKPKRPLIRGKLTRSQIAAINRRFNAIQKHGRFLPKENTVARPFYQSPDGWRFNKQHFQFTRKKITNTPDTIKTQTGTIIAADSGEKISARKDGTLIRKKKYAGKERTFYSGSLTNEQTMRFLSQVENGTYKIPDGLAIKITLFGNAIQQATWTAFESDLRHYFDRYISKIETYIAKHPDNPSPVAVEFMTL